MRPTHASAPGVRGATGALLFATLVALYMVNGRPVPLGWSGDTIPNRLIPFSLLRFGTVTIEPFRGSFERAGGYRWYVQESGGTLVSFYPIGTSLVATPFYAPILLGLAWEDRTSADDLFAASAQADKIVSAVMTATSVLLVWWALLSRTSTSLATVIAATLGSCTLLWPVASQTLWQHTALVLLIGVLVLVLERPPSPAGAVAAGVVASLMFATRPPALLFAAGAAVSLVWRRERRPLPAHAAVLAAFAAGFLPLAALVLAYNWHFYQSLAGGYSLATNILARPDPVGGALGLLLSPNRGLLPLSPITAVGLLGAVIVVHRGRDEPVMAPLLAAGVLHFLVNAATISWAGGWCFGPRYAVELLPLLAIASAAPLAHARRWTLALLGPLLVVSFLIQACGAFLFPLSNWNARLAPALEAHAWDWQHLMVWEDFTSWRAGGIPPY